MIWGLWDMRYKCWIGNEHGPNQYSDHLHARAAATIATEMFGRFIRPVELPLPPFKVKDVVTTKIDGAEAIRRIEGRIPKGDKP